jgi:hypothetical protein
VMLSKGARHSLLLLFGLCRFPRPNTAFTVPPQGSPPMIRNSLRRLRYNSYRPQEKEFLRIT